MKVLEASSRIRVDKKFLKQSREKLVREGSQFDTRSKTVSEARAESAFVLKRVLRAVYLSSYHFEFARSCVSSEREDSVGLKSLSQANNFLQDRRK